MADQTPDPIDVSLHRAITVAVGGMLGCGPEPEIASVALETIEAAGFRVVPIVDDVTRQEVARIVGHLRDDLPGWLDVIDRLSEKAGRPDLAGTEIQDDVRRAADLLAAAYLGRTD